METFGRQALSIYEGALGRFLSIIMEHWDEDARNSGDNTLAVWNAVVRGVVAIRTRGMSPSRKRSIIMSKPFTCRAACENLVNVRYQGYSVKHLFWSTFSHVAPVFDFEGDPAADFLRMRMEPPFG